MKRLGQLFLVAGFALLVWRASVPVRADDFVYSQGGQVLVAIKVGGVISAPLCIGPSQWSVTPGPVNWQAGSISNRWQSTTDLAFANPLMQSLLPNPEIKLSQLSTGVCPNVDYSMSPYVINSRPAFLVYPSGLYGAFAFVDSGGSGPSWTAVNEWYHYLHDQGLRSFPTSWTVSGTLND